MITKSSNFFVNTWELFSELKILKGHNLSGTDQKEPSTVPHCCATTQQLTINVLVKLGPKKYIQREIKKMENHLVDGFEFEF